jgi:hypothetical protein
MSNSINVVLKVSGTIIFQFVLTILLYRNHSKGHLGTLFTFIISIGLPFVLGFLTYLYIQKATISKLRPLYVFLSMGLAVLISGFALWVGMGLFGE